MYTERFGRRLAVASAMLTFLIAALSLALLLSGPRIRQVEYDAYLLPREVNQSVVLRANQPLKELTPEQVSVTPEADYSFVVSGEAVIFRFSQSLKYATEYKLKLTNLTAENGRSVDFSTDIKTAPAEYYYLKRHAASSEGSKISDEIRRTHSDGSETVVYQAHRILEYSLLGSRLCVLYATETDDQVLAVYDKSSGIQTNIPMPGEGYISNFITSPNGSLVAFVFTGGDYVNAPFVYDADKGIVNRIRVLDGASVSVDSWRFHPDGTSIIMLMADKSMLMTDVFDRQNPLPLGSYAYLGNFSRDGTKAVVGDPEDGAIVLTLADGSKQKFEPGNLSGYIQTYSGLRLLQNSSGLLQETYLYRSSPTGYHKLIESVDASARKTLYYSDVQTEIIYGYDSSSNDQYVTVEVADSADRQGYDNYFYYAYQKLSNTKTMIIDSNSGDVVRTVDGFRVVWR